MLFAIRQDPRALTLQENVSMNIYTPYTYLIGWSKHNKWYYGRRTAKNCNPSEFWVNYFTSSKYVEEFRKQFGEPDIIQIRKTFSDPELCCIWECSVLRRLDVQHDNKFLNLKNGDYSWDTTGISRKLSDKEIALIKERMKGNTHAKGKPKTEEHKKNISESQKGIPRPWQNGIKRSKETIDKIKKSNQGVNRDKVTCFDIETKQFIQIPKYLWNTHKGVRYFGTTSKITKQQVQSE